MAKTIFSAKFAKWLMFTRSWLFNANKQSNRYEMAMGYILEEHFVTLWRH
jgi:hypothetical protein